MATSANRFSGKFIVFIMGLFAMQVAFAPGLLAANGVVQFMAEELLIQPKAGVSNEEVEDIVRGHSGKIMDEIGALRVKRIRVPAHALERVKAALEKNPKMEFAEFNYIADSAYIPDDPYYSFQWHLPKISAPEAWDLTGTSTGPTIAVLDSGVDPDHPDLVGKIVPGYNFVGGNDDTHDVLGHGTSVAGTAAAAADNAAGVAGVSCASDIMPLVVLNSEDWATYYDIGRAITYAADRDVRIINVSIGGSSSSLTLQNAADYAWNKNAMVFACAQNYSTEAPYYPAACDNVVAVSATTQSDILASFSNYGDWIDLSAPGHYIYTTKNGGGYGYYNGTSFASPIVAGVAAMILEANPALDNSQVVDILKSSADDMGTQGFDPYFGFGRVNANQAVMAALEYEPVVDATPPEVVLVSPSDWEEVSGTIVVTADATDDVGIQSVEFFLDGAAFQTSFGAPFEFVWNTESLEDDVYYLSAVAYDEAGNQSLPCEIAIVVSNAVEEEPPAPPVEDTVVPVVSISGVADGDVVSKVVKITAEASDDAGVVSVEIFIDDSLVASGVSSTLLYSWNTKKATSGNHRIEARAYDLAGNIGVKSIAVSN